MRVLDDSRGCEPGKHRWDCMDMCSACGAAREDVYAAEVEAVEKNVMRELDTHFFGKKRADVAAATELYKDMDCSSFFGIDREPKQTLKGVRVSELTEEQITKAFSIAAGVRPERVIPVPPETLKLPAWSRICWDQGDREYDFNGDCGEVLHELARLTNQVSLLSGSTIEKKARADLDDALGFNYDGPGLDALRKHWPLLLRLLERELKKL